MLPRFLFLILALPTLCLAAQSQGDPIKFSRDIAPILLKNCQECHGPGKAKGKFRIDTFSRLTQPGDSNHPSITPGHPEKSELFRLISTSDEDDRMPKKSDRLPDAKIQLIKQWIEQGAAFDGTNTSAPLASILPRTQEPGPPDVYAHPVPITALAFNAEGSVLAASGYHEITLWDPATGKLLSRIRNLPERTWSLAFSPDGKLLASASGNPGASGELRLYTMSDPAVPQILERISDMMLVVRFSPDGSTLAAGGADNAIRIYDVQTRQRRQFIEQHADWITDLAFSPDGKLVASASRDKSARVFDVATGSMEAAYLGHTEAVLAIAWSPDGNQLFTAGQDRAIHIWDPAKPDKTLAKIPALVGDIYKLDAAGDTLLACCTDHHFRAYSIKKRTLTRATPTADWPYSLAINPQSHTIAVGNYNGQIQIFPPDSTLPTLTFIAAPGLSRN
jgi:dipeptidyl aminopeptidase/acylaminoacyl peptidase